MSGTVAAYFTNQMASAWINLPGTVTVALGNYSGAYPVIATAPVLPPGYKPVDIARSSLFVTTINAETVINVPSVTFGPFTQLYDSQGNSLPYGNAAASSWILYDNIAGATAGLIASGPLNSQSLTGVFAADYVATVPLTILTGLTTDAGAVIQSGDILQLGSPCKKNSEVVIVADSYPNSGAPSVLLAGPRYPHAAGEPFLRVAAAQRYFPGSTQAVTATIVLGSEPTVNVLINLASLAIV